MTNKSNNSEIAVLQTQVEDVQADITEIKSDVKTIITTIDSKYVTKEEFTNFKAFRLLTNLGQTFVSASIGALVAFFFTHK